MPNQTLSQKEKQLLLRRMLHLKNAIEQGIITPDELASLTEDTAIDRAPGLAADPENADNIKLLPKGPLKTMLLALFDPSNFAITDAKPVENELQNFEALLGDYLPLQPLCSLNCHTVANSDFSDFYKLFIKHIKVSEKKQKYPFMRC